MPNQAFPFVALGLFPALLTFYSRYPDIKDEKKGKRSVGAHEIAHKQAYRSKDYNQPYNGDHNNRKALFHCNSLK
jgi:hypothetical protein